MARAAKAGEIVQGKDRYVPIDCGFHDELLALATRRQKTTIIFRRADPAAFADGETDEPTTVDGVIVDVFSCQGAEYLRLESGLEIRLDRLVAIDDGKRVIRA